MITSKLPPSRMLGSVGTTVCCPAFTCFVSTARRMFVTSSWETAVFEVPPLSDSNMKIRVRFGYEFKSTQKGSQLIHDMFCDKLNTTGDAGHESLGECLSHVITELSEGKIISWVTAY